MDVDTDMRDYAHLLKNQKAILLMAKKRQGERPCDRKSRGVACCQFMMMHTSINAKNNSNTGHMMRTSFIPPAYLPCTTSIAKLQPISINQLCLETHHRGTYILLRAITPPCRMTGILAICEDENGDVMLLQMYQQGEDKVRDITDIVDEDAVMLVKEPYFKLTASGDYAIRVDHLSDVIRLNGNDAMIPLRWSPRLSEIHQSIEPLKKKGDASMGKHMWWKAIHDYSDALAFGGDPARIEIIKRNRSLAYLKTKQYDAALLDTNWPDFGPEPSEKALFRSAEALYHLRRYTESVAVLETLYSSFPNNPEALCSLNRARSRCAEVKSGKYKFKTLQREAKQLIPPHLEQATFTGPIQVKQTATKGRGVFVTKAVNAGDLLLCEKALAHAYVAERGEAGNSQTTLLLNIETNTGFMGGQADLVRMIAQKFYLNPSVAPLFTSLYHGDYKATMVDFVDGKPIVDSFLIERTIALNVFGCPISSLAAHKDTMRGKSVEDKSWHSCGIWPQASLINHSCIASAHRSFIGDTIIVRAARDLEPGEEVTFWYEMPIIDGEIGDKLKNWGFECDCAMCEEAKRTKVTVKKERKKLKAALMKECSASRTRLAAIENLIKKLEATYNTSADIVPRLGLWAPQMQVARIHMANDNAAQAFKSACKVLVCLGFSLNTSESSFEVKKWGLVLDYLVDAFVFIRNALIKLNASGSAEKADEYARTVYSIVVGESETFEKMYAGRVV